MANNSSNAPQKRTSLASAMTWLGGIAGFLYGGGVGSEDPEVGFGVGAMSSALVGAILGWAASLAVGDAFQLAFIALFILLIAGRLYWFFVNMNFAIQTVFTSESLGTSK